MQKPFNPAEAGIWKILVRTLFDEDDMAISPDQVVENIQRQFSMMPMGRRQETALSLYPIWVVLGGPLFQWGSKSFRRRQVERKMRRSRVDLFQDFARLRGLIYAGYYGNWQGLTDSDNETNPVLAEIGYTLPHRRVRNQPDDRPVIKNTARDLTSTAFVGEDAIPDDAEVIVIGSGAGGAVAARNLALSGYRVLVVESGGHHPSSQISVDEQRMSANLFRDGAIQTTRNRDIVVFQGHSVGGSTVINNGICLRVEKPGMTHPMADDVLAKWASLGAPVTKASLDAAYDAIEDYLKIGEVEHRVGRANGHHLLNGWSSFAASSNDPLDQNAIAAWFRKNWGALDSGHECVSCGYCNTGCPYGRKHAMPESFLREATGNGSHPAARILANARVREILWGSKDGNGRRVAKGIKLTLSDGQERTVAASKGVVVAAGSIQSSRLLSASGVKGTGTGISLNIACPVVALMPTERRSWDEDQMATYVDRGDFLIESHFQPPMSMSTLVPGWFEDHRNRMRNYSNLASAGVLFPADRLGEVKDGKLSFNLGEGELALLRRALTILVQVHFAAGATEVYPALLKGETLYPGMTEAQITAYFEREISEPDDVVLSSSHPHGGNAIGIGNHLGVVDMNHRVHGTANVLVTDASVFPSCIRVNAQLTTMAMSYRATHGQRPFG